MKEEIYIRVMRIFFLRDLSTLRVVNIAIYIYIYILPLFIFSGEKCTLPHYLENKQNSYLPSSL